MLTIVHSVRRPLLLAALVLCPLLSAVSQVREAWMLMPDSVCPYLNRQQRLNLLRYAEMGVLDTVRNALDGRSWVDSISLEQITVHLTPNLTWQVRVLPADSIAQHAPAAAANTGICVKATLCAPICTEARYYYDTLWQLLKREATPPTFETDTTLYF